MLADLRKEHIANSQVVEACNGFKKLAGCAEKLSDERARMRIPTDQSAGGEMSDLLDAEGAAPQTVPTSVLTLGHRSAPMEHVCRR